MSQAHRWNVKVVWFAAAIVCVIWVGLAAGVAWVHHDLNHDLPTPLATALIGNLPPTTSPTALPILWDAPTFSFADQTGRTTTDRDLRGHPYVADFIYTTCTTACPTLTAKLALLRKQVRSPDVAFVSFSVDPIHDTPAVLRTYADTWGNPDPRWRLLSTDPAGLQDLAKGFRVTVEPTGDLDNPFLHSTLFLLVDADGHVRGVYDSTDSESVARLAGDVEGLAGNEMLSPAATPGPVAADAAGRGRLLYTSMGCMACHAQPRVAPPLTSVFNSMVRLSDGQTIWADEAYLHESIANPAARIVAGYLNTMPSYRGHLDDRQTADLVAYVESLSTNPPGGHGVVPMGRGASTRPDAVVVDPVCHMHVAVNPSTIRAIVGGRTLYFCSDTCREKFEKDPSKYVPK
jgi:protein SCO1/2